MKKAPDSLKNIFQIWFGLVWIFLVFVVHITLNNLEIVVIVFNVFMTILYFGILWIFLPLYLKSISWSVSSDTITVKSGAFIKKERIVRREYSVSQTKLKTPLMKYLNVSIIIISQARGFVLIFEGKDENEKL